MNTFEQNRICRWFNQTKASERIRFLRSLGFETRSSYQKLFPSIEEKEIYDGN